MPELIATEPALFNPDEVWLIFSDGRRCLRKRTPPKAAARSSFPTPMLRSDTIDPIRGPDGRMHDSLSGFRAACRPDGNPQGERYLELGDQELPAFKAPEFDPQARRDAIRAGIADVKAGRVPPVVTGELP